LSGIAAILRRDGAPAADADLARIEAALRLHGPDRQGRKALGEAGLVACLMLGFTPQDRHERQPLFAQPGLHLAFDGWIANRDEIEPMLGIEPERARSMPDSTLAMAAWRRWGEGALDRMDGAFALIVWDEVAHRLTAARSVRGAPPLHWHESTGRIVLATTAGAIHALGDVARALDEVKFADSLVLNYNDAERSYFKHINRLRMGRVMTASQSGLAVRRYFDLRAAPPVRFARDDDYVDAGRELLERAVRRSLRTNETPAMMLSAGLDSTAVAVTAIGQLRGVGGAPFPLVSFTAVPEPGWEGQSALRGAMGDESGPVRELAALYPEIEANFVDCAGQDFTTWLDRLFLLGEAPPRAVNNLAWYVEILRQARQRGKRVVLTGESGNGTFSLSGVGLFPQLARRGRWLTLWRQLRALGYPRRAMLRPVAGFALLPLLPPRMGRMLRLLLGDDAAHGHAVRSVIRADYAREIDLAARMRATGFDDTFAQPAFGELRSAAMFDSGAGEDARCVAMGAQALTCVQVRDPLADRALAAFCAGLPQEQLLWNGVDRRLARRLMAGRLPDAVLRAPYGDQGADAFARTTRLLPEIARELEAARGDPLLGRAIDIERLERIVRSWPEREPRGPADHADYQIIRYGLPRTLAAMRHARWVSGSNR